MSPQQARITLSVVMLISFLGTAGIALPYPVLAPYFLDSADNTLTMFMNIEPKLLLGIALAVYPLGMLIGGSFIGALSDLYGRRRLLIITLIGTALSYLFTAYAVVIESYPLFILSRIAAGICEGNVAIARAMAADLHPHIEKVRAMSLLFATVYAGWLFGPLAGGYLMVLGVEWVFTIAAAATFLTMIVVAIGIKTRESRPDEERSLMRIVVEENSFALLKHRVIWPLFSFYLIYTFAINLFYEFYPVWLVERFQYDSQEIAWMTVVITTFMIMSSVFLATRLIQWFGQFLTLVIGVFVLPLLILLLTISSENAVFVLYALIGTTIAIINAVTPTYMSDRFESFGQGKIMGLQTSLFFFANVVMAIIGALIAMMSVDATMIAASMIMFMSFIWFFVTGESSQLKSQYAHTK